MGMGQAAALGAALVIDQKLDAIRELDGKLVRRAMIDNGVALDKLPGGYWEQQRMLKGDFAVSAADMIEIREKKEKTP
jgi:hypothetical protein